jgi:hypothetical protein
MMCASHRCWTIECRCLTSKEHEASSVESYGGTSWAFDCVCVQYVLYIHASPHPRSRDCLYATSFLHPVNKSKRFPFPRSPSLQQNRAVASTSRAAPAVSSWTDVICTCCHGRLHRNRQEDLAVICTMRLRSYFARCQTTRLCELECIDRHCYYQNPAFGRLRDYFVPLLGTKT